MDGILSKKRMKIYFLSLPGYNNDPSVAASPDLRDYQAASLKASSNKKEGVLLDHHHHGQTTVNAEDIGCGLSELLPVVSVLAKSRKMIAFVLHTCKVLTFCVDYGCYDEQLKKRYLSFTIQTALRPWVVLF